MRITTADKILVAALLILNGWLFANWGTGFSKGDWVVVTVNQKETIRLPLNQDQINLPLRRRHDDFCQRF